MPCYTFEENTDRNSSNGADGKKAGLNGSQPPEPPQGYDAQRDIAESCLADNGKAPGKSSGTDGSDDRALAFRDARRFITAAQVISLVSLFIGGVVLSAAAIAAAITGYRKATLGLQAARNKVSAWQLLKRSGVIALVMSFSTLVLNAISLIVIYPMIVEMMQSGDYASLLAGGGAQGEPAPSTSGNSTWG